MHDATEILELVERELCRISDERLVKRVRELTVLPYPVERDWNYGTKGQRFVCWTVLEHQPSNTAIAYCSQGFGPAYPWGLVHLSGDNTSMGMDSGWFALLEDAMRESMAWDGPNPDSYEVA